MTIRFWVPQVILSVSLSIVLAAALLLAGFLSGPTPAQAQFLAAVPGARGKAGPSPKAGKPGRGAAFAVAPKSNGASASPAASAPSAPGEAPFVDPTKQVADFFTALAENRVDDAYDQLLRGTRIAGMTQEVSLLKTKTREVLREFGALSGHEMANVKYVGRGLHLLCLTCISLGKELPIRWRFYFYNPEFKLLYPNGADEPPIVQNGQWRLIDIRIDDRLPDLFEEAPANGKKPFQETAGETE